VADTYFHLLTGLREVLMKSGKLPAGAEISDEDLDFILDFAKRQAAEMRELKAAVQKSDEKAVMAIARRIFGIEMTQ
jgi:hypothetical protein